MHIKRIELCGFKSYRDVTVVEDLSEGYNVIGTRGPRAWPYPRAPCPVFG